MKTQYYYAQVDGLYINYLFRNDYTFTRLKDTTLICDTIIYNKNQLQVLKQIHPTLNTIKYGNSMRRIYRPPVVKVLDLDNIINYIKNDSISN